MIWHSNTVADVLADLHVDPAVGLSTPEVAQRLDEYGENRPQEQKALTLVRAFAARLRSPLTALLLAVSAIVLILDLYKQVLKSVDTNWYLPIVVAALTVVIALLGALRQCRAASWTDWVHTLSSADTHVRRDGSEQECSILVLVPGDVVLLSAGDIVPADCRLIEADGLLCDECTLTGATMPTEKYAETVFDDITPLAQRTNMLYAGTTITAGTATAVVVATGMRSEMGHSTGYQPQTHHDLPAQKKARQLNVWWGVTAAVISIVALIIGLMRLPDRSAVLLTVTAMAMAAVPIGLAALYTRLIAGGVMHLLRHHVRILRPEAMETLSQVTVVGIEQNMLWRDDGVSLCRAFVGHHDVNLTTDTPKAPGLGQLLRLTALNITDTDPTDKAILTRLRKLGIDKNELVVDMPRIGELPSDSTHKTTVHLANEQTLVLVSGRWRSLLPLCIKGNIDELTAAATAMEHDGLQVMAVTYRLMDTAPSVYTAEVLERELTCAGLLGLHIPLRTDAPHITVSDVRTILFSEESTAVAVATAQSAGLTDTPYVAVGEVIRTLSDADLAAAVKHYNVYCGLDTAQKQRVLTALQQQGEVVAVTSCRDDETALLTAADVGCARGADATNVIKAAADLILLDESCTTLLSAIQECRRLRLRKTGMLVYLLLCSAGLLFMGFGSLFGLLPLPHCALLLMSLHLLLLALPTPFWVTVGISNVVYTLHKK